MNIDGFEIERKYLIRMPDQAFLSANAVPSQIEQTYLRCAEPEANARVRRRGQEGDWVYTYTRKIRLSDLRRIEDEREIDENEYRELLTQADPERNTIRKTRWVLPYEGQLFEIDIFPFWTDRAIMEIELRDESQQVTLPPQVEIVREVTGDRRYANSAMSVTIPRDEL